MRVAGKAATSWAVAMAAVLAVTGTTGSVQAAPAVEPGSATWHIGLVDLWGGDTSRNESRRLDIYPVFEDGGWTQALATARRYNTSIHFVEKSTVKLRGERVAGDMEVLITPDAWVPKDGMPYTVHVTVDGKLSAGDGEAAWTLSGTYKARLDDKLVSGALIGGVGATETGWDDSVWHVEMTPVQPPTDPPQPMVVMNVGVAEGKAQWGTVGRTFKGACPRTMPLDVSGLSYDGDTVSGTLRLPGRGMDATVGPEVKAEVDVKIHRVQGLIGGMVTFGFTRDGKPVGKALRAYGRGGGSKGGGKRSPDALEGLWRHEISEDPWWVPVEGHSPPKPGEHPRLLFRKGDVEALRKKAETPAGKAIVNRLRYLLDGKDGETMTTIFSKATHAYMGGGFDNKTVDIPGCYTFSHAAGYGLLYQLTGDRKYADFGRQCFEKAWAGVRDRDDRYSWKGPGGALRAGPVLGWYAVGYDLCYDGWDEGFRRKVAQAIQDYQESDKGESFPALVRGTHMHPGSNHWGMQVGGGALAALAIQGDPGVDMAKVGPLVEDSSVSMIRAMRYGWGDHGFFAEGDGTGSMSAHIAFLPALQAWRVAGGRDFISPRPYARWMTLKWIHMSVPTGGMWFPTRGGYGHNVWNRDGLSGSGYFGEGFASVLPQQRPALLWFYETHLKEKDAQRGTPYDTPSPYPHSSVLSLVNWPLDIRPVNPEKTLDKAQVDTVYGLFFTRNRWKDGKDIVVSHMVGSGPDGYIRVKDGGKVMVRGLGLGLSWSTDMREATPVVYETAKDGSFIVSALKNGELSSFAVDFSGASGAEAVLVGVGPAFNRGKPRLPKPSDGASAAFTEVKAGGQTYRILTLQTGEASKAAADGDAVRIGRQVVRFDGKQLVLKQF